MFATASIPCGDWLCEYKGIVSPKAQADRRVEEYKLNGEGSYTITSTYPVGGGVRLSWDATREYHQLGRYLNHARNPNAVLCSPLFVRGKWRIGFLACQDIREGEEVVWDYGVATSETEWAKTTLRHGVLVEEVRLVQCCIYG